VIPQGEKIMQVFVAPIPIIHANSMLKDIENGEANIFAFGSNSEEAFVVCMEQIQNYGSLDAYLYVSHTGMPMAKPLLAPPGITIKGRLLRWIEADKYGNYPENYPAHRTSTTEGDTAFIYYWEIDSIQKIPKRIPNNQFCHARTYNPLPDIIRAPLLAAIKGG
jgi:hypothetical protein